MEKTNKPRYSVALLPETNKVSSDDVIFAISEPLHEVAHKTMPARGRNNQEAIRYYSLSENGKEIAIMHITRFDNTQSIVMLPIKPLSQDDLSVLMSELNLTDGVYGTETYLDEDTGLLHLRGMSERELVIVPLDSFAESAVVDDESKKLILDQAADVSSLIKNEMNAVIFKDSVYLGLASSAFKGGATRLTLDNIYSYTHSDAAKIYTMFITKKEVDCTKARLIFSEEDYKPLPPRAVDGILEA